MTIDTYRLMYNQKTAIINYSNDRTAQLNCWIDIYKIVIKG